MNVILVLIGLSIPAGVTAKVRSGNQEQMVRDAMAAQALAAYKERKPGGAEQPRLFVEGHGVFLNLDWILREVTVSVTLMSAFGELPENDVETAGSRPFGLTLQRLM